MEIFLLTRQNRDLVQPPLPTDTKHDYPLPLAAHAGGGGGGINWQIIAVGIVNFGHINHWTDQTSHKQ